MSHLHYASQIEGAQTINPTFHICPQCAHIKMQPLLLLQGKDPDTPNEDVILCNFAEYAGQVVRAMLGASVLSPSLPEIFSSLCSFLSFLKREWFLQNSSLSQS